MAKKSKSKYSCLKIWLLFFVSTFLFSVSAKNRPLKDSTSLVKMGQQLQSLLQRYYDSKNLVINFKQNKISGLLGSLTPSEGQFKVQKYAVGFPKFSLKFFKPQEAHYIYDGSQLWIIEKKPEAFGGEIKVSRSQKMNKRLQTNVLLKVLISGGFLDDFYIAEVKVLNARKKEYHLKPKVESNSLKSLVLRVGLKSGLDFVKYADSLKNNYSYYCY